MGDKKKVKEIIKNIEKTKKRVASKFDKRFEEKERLFSLVMPVLFGVVFLIFSVINLKSPVSYNEAYSAYLVRGDFSQVIGESINSLNPPIFYIVLKMWSSIFGTSEVAMRFMSIFFGLVSIVVLYQLLKKWFNVKIAISGTFFVAISPMFIRYAQEIGSYTMMTAITLMVVYFLDSRLDNSKAKKGKKNKNKKLKTVLIIFGAIILSYLPRVIIRLASTKGGEEISGFSMKSPADLVSNVLFYKNAGEVESWIAIFGIITFGAIAYNAYKLFKTTTIKNRTTLSKILILIAIPIILMTVFSLPPFRGSFISRDVLFSVVLIWAMVGITITLTKDKKVKKILMILMLIVSLFGIVNVQTREPESHIKDIMAEVFMVAEEKEPILIGNEEKYYEGVFYSSEKHPVSRFEGKAEDEKFWYVFNRPKTGEEVELPEAFSEYYIKSEITLDHYTALELSK